MLTVHLDHQIRISTQDVANNECGYIFPSIKEALSIPNIERQRAMEQGVWGWQRLPLTIDLWEIRDGWLRMPRGFLPNLLNGLDAFDINWIIEDNRTYEDDLPMPEKPIELRAWQEPAVRAIRIFGQGIWKAPAGSGKTVAVLEAIRRSKSLSIVLVNTKDILRQWQDRAYEFLGINGVLVGQIGDGIFRVGEFLTIATAQTLHIRYEELERSGFFDQFSFMCLDECHHATAETYNLLVNRFSARIRIGVSATPDKTGDFALATNVLGPIFHETPKEVVDSIIKPEVFKVMTEYKFDFRARKGARPSNYPQLLMDLVTDPDRNELIAKSIMLNEDAHSLVVSKRIEHLRRLMGELEHFGYKYQMYMLTGNESSDQRARVIEAISLRPGVVFSTLADEALDIPRLDSLFLVFPQRNPGLIEQQVGRICRAHADKANAVVFDFADHQVGILDNQWKARRTQVYMPHSYKIRPISAEAVMNFEISK